MNKILYVLLFVLVVSNIPLLAQKGESNPNSNDYNNYKLNVSYKTNIFHNYSFEEISKIQRIKSDSTKENYERRVLYYFTLLQNTIPEKGFYIIKVMMDSLRYEFYENGVKKIYFDSQDDDSDAPFNQLDFLSYVIPMGKEFFLTYSAYNELAKIDGDALMDSRKAVNDEDNGIKDQKLNYIWNNSLSDNFLAFFTNVQRNLIPAERVFIDSAWVKPFDIYVDGIRYNDSAQVKLTAFSPRGYVIRAELDSLVGTDEFFTTTGYPDLIQPTSSLGKGIIRMEVSPRGQINLVEMNLITEFTAKVGKEPFKQKSETKYTWTLGKMYR